MSKRLTRRRFAQAGLAAGVGAFAGPQILPAKAVGANDRVVVGMIGVGNRGRDLLRDLKGRVDIAAIADVYLPRAREAANSVGAKHVYQDYRKLLERDDVDAVVIATPHRWHALNSIHAAQAGKDIYCEKPLSYSIREGRLIVEAVRKHKRVLQVGTQLRSQERVYRGCMHVRNGSIGKVNRVLAVNYHSPMEIKHPAQDIPKGLDWDMWCGPAEPPPYNFVIWDNRSKPSWSSVRPFSGGDISEGGPHGLDLAHWGIGMDKSGPTEVWTEGEPFKPVTSTPETTGERHGGPNSPKIFMKYPGDIVLALAGGPSNGAGVHFVGENGTVQVGNNHVASDPAELVAKPVENPKIQIERSYDHIGNWLECIKERRDPIASAEVGHRSATVCHLGNIARWVSEITGETGPKLQWDAQKERFTNSPQANRFLAASYRKGYELPKV